MFIQTQDTPNPQTMKFIPGVSVLESGTMSFSRDANLSQSPLATSLFNIAGVEGVFFAQEFITVTKNPNNNWDSLKTIILAAIMDHFVAGYPVMNHVDDKTENAAILDPLSHQIKEIIELRVRPAVAEDGGDIIFKEFVDGVVYVEMHGACSGCPSSIVTLKSGIENMLKHFVPEVKEVRAV